MNYAFVDGVLAALSVILLFALIWILAKSELQRWSYSLNRETYRQLHEADLKLDSIARGQQRILSQMERLERAMDTQRSIASDLRTRLSGSTTAS
jgi:hypothetical protein